MKRTIFFKTFWGYLFIVISVTLFFVLFSLRTIEKWHVERMSDALFRIAMAMRSSIQNVIEEEPSDLDGFVKNLGKTINIRITVIKPDGIVLADSISNSEQMENHGDRPEIIKAMRGFPTENLRFSTTLMSNMLYMAVPIIENDTIIGVIRLSLFVEHIRLLSKSIKKQIICIAIILILISLVITFLISRGISMPAKQLAVAAKRVAEGDYNVSVFTKDKGELGELALSFNEMVHKQKILFDNLLKNKEELKTIISSIKECLVVMDYDGKIVLTNDSFNMIVEDKSPIGKKYWEVFRSTAFYNLIQEIIKTKKNISGEVELGDRIFISNFTVLSSQDTVVVTLHDISERKKLEVIKRDFVINVSHELKTPLTSIKGFVEVLEDDIKGENKRYLEIIRRNTDRLINIVKDLLLLSGLEEKTFKLDLKHNNIKDLVGKTIKLFKPRLKEKNLYLKLEAEENLPEVKCDAFKLEDMLVNLIDNAIKYTEKGGITIRLNADEHRFRFEIEDTGIGIANEYQDRIFERFYVIDLSRSKAYGGTGLGLSIVKHIVLLHNGDINVKSELNKGTIFVIELPLS